MLVALAALIVAGLASLESQTDGLSWTAIAILGLLAAVATNIDTDTRASTAVSGDVMVFIAAIIVFRESANLLGPALVGLFGGLALLHLRSHEWHKIAINSAVDCIALVVAALSLSAVAGTSTSRPAMLVLGTMAAALVYIAVNSALLSVPISIATEQRYRSVLKDFGPFTYGAYAFALLGLGLGWVYLELGPAIVLLFVVPILIARSAFASYLELRASQEQTIETLIVALEAKDHYTAGHAQRVAQFSSYVGEEFGFGPRRMERLRYAALMHDIGKLIVPNQILNKPGRLTEAEFERVRRHEPVSVELLGRIDFLAPVAGDTTTEAASAAVDGGGLIEPAIIHVADAFDAMTSTRSYRRALSQDTAFEELRSGTGTQFNEKCVAALIRAIEQRGERYGAGHEIDEHEWAVAPPEAGTGSAGLGHLVSEEQGTG